MKNTLFSRRGLARAFDGLARGLGIALSLAAFLMFSVVPNAFAATGEGSATVGGNASQTVEILSDTKFSIVLTVGAGGIAADAADPTFTIPAIFTEPGGTGETLISDVNVAGKWFGAGSGAGTCAIEMATSSATGQIITLNVTGACSSGDFITLTYQGVAPATAAAATNIIVKTAAESGDGVVVAIGSPPTIVVNGTSVFADHGTAEVATTNNLVGIGGVGGTDLVLGGFQITAAGESINVTTIRTTVTLGTMAIGELTNLRIVEDDGTGSGTANDGVMHANELAAPLATIASPTSGDNDFTVTDTVAIGVENYFIVGTIAATVSHNDTLDVEATGTGSVSAGATSAAAVTLTGTSANVERTITDTTAPTNQDTVFASNAYADTGASVAIVSSGDATNEVWFAPLGTGSFTAGSTMTQAASGTATTILAPTTVGSYRLFVKDATGNLSAASTAILTARGSQSSDSTAPAAPTDIELSINSDNQVVITWADPTDSDLDKVEILRGVDPLPVDGATYDAVLKGVETYTDTDVSVGDVVTYILRSKDSSSNSSVSDEYSITVEVGSATPATPATPADPGVSPATPATPATPVQRGNRYGQAGVTESEVDSAVGAFSDLVKGAWHAPFIARMRNMAVLGGYPDGSIKPDRMLNRAELAKIAAKAFDLSAATESFDDVPNSSWYAPFVGALQSAGAAWTTGSDFRPAEGVSRGEALWTLLAAAGVDLDNVDIEKLFPDVNIKHRFAAAITYAAQNSVVNGYENGNFGPGDTLTRGQVAKIVSLIKDL